MWLTKTSEQKIIEDTNYNFIMMQKIFDKKTILEINSAPLTIEKYIDTLLSIFEIFDTIIHYCNDYNKYPKGLLDDQITNTIELKIRKTISNILQTAKRSVTFDDIIKCLTKKITIKEQIIYKKCISKFLNNKKSLPLWFINDINCIFNFELESTTDIAELLLTCSSFYYNVVEMIIKSKGYRKMIINKVQIINDYSEYIDFFNTYLEQFKKDPVKKLTIDQFYIIKENIIRLNSWNQIKLQNDSQDIKFFNEKINEFLKRNNNILPELFIQILSIITCQIKKSVEWKEWLEDCPENYRDQIKNLINSDFKYCDDHVLCNFKKTFELKNEILEVKNKILQHENEDLMRDIEIFQQNETELLKSMDKLNVEMSNLKKVFNSKENSLLDTVKKVNDYEKILVNTICKAASCEQYKSLYHEKCQDYDTLYNYIYEIKPHMYHPMYMYDKNHLNMNPMNMNLMNMNLMNMNLLNMNPMNISSKTENESLNDYEKKYYNDDYISNEEYINDDSFVINKHKNYFLDDYVTTQNESYISSQYKNKINTLNDYHCDTDTYKDTDTDTDTDTITDNNLAQIEKIQQPKINKVTLMKGKCSVCNVSKVENKLKCCGICKRNRYCSRKCQKIDWPVHKRETCIRNSNE